MGTLTGKSQRGGAAMKTRCVVVLTLIVAVSLIVLGIGWYWMQNEKLRFAGNLANGINLGNTLDATGLREYVPDADELSFETFWGNPVIMEEQFAAIRNTGFRSVRIPVTWEDHMTEDGVISGVWLDRVEEVVRMAIDEDLYVILDTHHETWLDLDTARTEEICAVYRKVWTQIAGRFSDVDEHLIFEGMNEPRLRGSEHEWDAGTKEMRQMVNRLNAEFIDAVRAAGGENETRYLMISPYATGVEKEALEELALPDGNIIVAVHMYQPYSFCQDENGTAEWSAKETEDTAQLLEAFERLDELFLQKGIPVVITEYGCCDKGNEEARAAWISFFTEQANERGIPCIWWDNGSTYQLLNRETGEWTYPGLVDRMTAK